MVQGHDSSKKQPYSWQMAGYYQEAQQVIVMCIKVQG